MDDSGTLPVQIGAAGSNAKAPSLFETAVAELRACGVQIDTPRPSPFEAATLLPVDVFS
jgi:hypothetical protein